MRNVKIITKEYIEQHDLLCILSSDLLGYACEINLENDSGTETIKAKYAELKRVINLIEDQKSIEVKCLKDIDPIFVDASCIINVVRCKDCVNYTVDSFNQKVCTRTFNHFCMKDDDFCSYGKMRSSK